MASRTSSRVVAWPSLIRPWAEQIWARRAIAALEGVVVHEGLLQRMQRATLAQALDRDDVRAIARYGERQAAVDSLAVDQDRAGAALAMVAAFLGAGQVLLLAKQIEQRRPGLDGEAETLTVDGQRNLDGADRSCGVGSDVIGGSHESPSSRMCAAGLQSGHDPFRSPWGALQSVYVFKSIERGDAAFPNAALTTPSCPPCGSGNDTGDALTGTTGQRAGADRARPTPSKITSWLADAAGGVDMRTALPRRLGLKREELRLDRSRRGGLEPGRVLDVTGGQIDCAVRPFGESVGPAEALVGQYGLDLVCLRDA